jgi:hypothetical protein
MSGLFGNTSSGFGGLSQFDVQSIIDAMNTNMAAIHNRYSQLGLGVPSGDPKTAAATGTNLQYGGPSTMESQDLEGQSLQGLAGIGMAENQTAGTQQGGSGGNLGSTLGSLAGLAGSLGMFA